MAPKQEDRGVEPEGDEIVLTGRGPQIVRKQHVEDATGRPAAIENDLSGD